jgi:flagellar motility protein MotE (MotC chaperone)
MTAIRVLPALAVAAGVALVFKATGFASAPWSTILDAHAAGDPAAVENKSDAGVAAGSDPAAPPAAPVVQTASVASTPGDAASQGEADVLRSLAARREALSARERDLALREQTLAIAEKRIEERVDALKSIEARINAALGQRESAQAAQIQALIRMYESMKPGDAAKIFEKMNQDILVAVTSKMKPVKLGAVLALMDPGKAQDLTVLLANRLNPDRIMNPAVQAAAPVEAAAPAPAAVPPPPATPVLQPDVLPQPKAELAPPAAATLPADTLPANTLPPAAPVAPAAAPGTPAPAPSKAAPAPATPTPATPGKS